MKNGELIKVFNGLMKVESTSDAFPVSIGFKVVQNRIAIENAITPYDEMKRRIVQKYADGKDVIKSGDPHFAECYKAITELDSQDADVTLKKVKLEDIAGLSLPMETISALSCMIEE